MTIGATEAALSQPAAGWYTAAGWVFGSAILVTLIVEARARHGHSQRDNDSNTRS